MRCIDLPVALGAAVLAAACGAGEDAGWRGVEPHVALHGSVAGLDIDLELDEAAASDLGRAFCKREYEVPVASDPATWADGTMPSVEATVRVVEGGVEKEFELGFTAADFLTVDVPGTLAVMPAVEDATPMGGTAFLEIEWQWEDPVDGFVTWEGSATSGTIELAELSGDPGDGVVAADGTGALGVWFDATWDEGSLAGSLTIPCGPNEVE